MNPPVITQIAHADPNADPLNINELIDLLNTLLSSQITGSYIPYVISNTAPGVDDQDKAWIELDATGRPKAIRTFFSGNWRRIYNGMLGEVRGFSGDPTDLTKWDANGHGVIGGDYDGWQICNGLNGSPDLSDKFLIGGHMNNSGGHSGYSSGWQTFVDGVADLKTGGNASVTLDAAHTYFPGTPDVVARFWSATGNAPNPHVAGLWGVKSNSTPADNDNIVNGVAAHTTPDPINILNPFIAIGWMIFQGY